MSFSHLRRARVPVAFVTHACFLFSFVASRPARANDGPAVEIAVEGGSEKPVVPSPVSAEQPTTGPELKSSAVPSETTMQAPSAPIVDQLKVKGGIIGGDPAAKVKDNPIAGPVDQSGLVVDSLAIGGDKTGVSSQAIAIPQGSGKLQGMGESFSAQISTGVAGYSIPFALIGARGDAQPSLVLGYSSSAGRGVAGVGWEVGVPFIARQTDRGIPRYLDPPAGGAWQPTQDRFVFNGGQELVPICLVTGGACTGALVGEVIPSWAAGWLYFRPRIEGSYQRFFWSPDHRTWRVQSKEGVTLELGGDDDALEANPDVASQIFRWNIARSYDAHFESPAPAGGEARPLNVVAYRYLHLGAMSYLSDIYDTPPVAGAAGAALTAYAHHTHLRYETRPDVSFGFRRGWRVDDSQRLLGVDVTSKTAEGDASSARELVRRYHLEYDVRWHVSILASLQLEGKCASASPAESSELLPATTSCPTLPAMTFDYQHVDGFDGKGASSKADLAGYEAFDERVHAMDGSPPNSIDEEQTDLFDINSDGLPDVLVTAPAFFGGNHGVFFNGGKGVADSFAPSTMPVLGVLAADASVITLKNANISAADIDGDAKIDLLHMPRVKDYSVYTPVGSGLSWSWQGRKVTTADLLSPKIDFGRDAQNMHMLDVNADGLVDVVYVSGTEVDTFFSLGRYPGGDGLFGQAKWTGPTSASLSTDPVRMCVPWSGTPVRLSDKEIRIADMNGDGLPDIVKVQKGNIQYWPGRGNGLWGTGNLGDCAAGTFGDKRDVAMTSSPYFTEPDVAALRFDDVNGDGLDDLVQIRFTDVDVWLNVDGQGWTDRHTLAGTPAAPSYANRVRLVDVNGSGTRDILWGDGLNYRYIDLTGGKQPWLLTRVDNGSGKSTQLDYAASTELMLAAEKTTPWVSKMPTPHHVLVRETETDNLGVGLVGRPAGVYVTEYSYADPLYDGRQREFRGFQAATVRRIGDANSPSASTRSTFLLGQCKDEDGKSAGDPCGSALLWRDNRREALKGLALTSETFDDLGVFQLGVHHTYRLRQLYLGLDGRVVRDAFESASDTYAFDTSSFAPSSDSETLTDVELETALGPSSIDTASAFPVRSKKGTAHLQDASLVDFFGNEVDDIDRGCIGGEACSVADEVLTNHTTPRRRSDDPTGWMWRTVESYTYGSTHPTLREHTTSTYDLHGDLVETHAILEGSLALHRHHEDASASTAPSPATASHDGDVFVASTAYDAFGNPTLQRAPLGRCRQLSYDSAYAELPSMEMTYAGPVLSGATCGSVPLTASGTYDRGLKLLRHIVDLHGEVTDVTYDGFGRFVSLTRPDPAHIGLAGSRPSVTVDYDLASKARPYSIIHTRLQDGLSVDDDVYRDTYSYVDGFGRTMVLLDQGDPSGGGGDWVVSGLTDYDAKGAMRRAFRAWFWSGDPRAFPVGSPAPTRYGSKRYDAFGRDLQSFNLDGTITVANVYHALSTDTWDAADLSPGPHYGTPPSVTTDGHGRTTIETERIQDGAALEARETRSTYLPTGEVETVTRVRVGKSDPPVVRWMRYDSLGRMVLNVEPDTSLGFTALPASADLATLEAWRYAYDDNGELVGTSDARGCGTNYVYDAAGRLVLEDYSPCQKSHAKYSAIPEASYHYDTADIDVGKTALASCSSSLLLGRLVSISDRAQKTITCYDGRGRQSAVARAIAQPDSPGSYTHWYSQKAVFDSADRIVEEETGNELPSLMGGDGRSVMKTHYSRRGDVKAVDGSYGTLVEHAYHDADKLTDEIRYGDLAGTTTSFSYDDRKRLRTVQTYRGPPSAWSGAGYPSGTVGKPTSFQLLLQSLNFSYDAADNPIEIRDFRVADEWPAGAKPVTQKIDYDDLYRVQRIEYAYKDGADSWTDPYAAESTGAADVKLAKPSPRQTFGKRVLWQSFAFDWLGNTVRTDDDAHGFYDRSLGTVGNGTAGAGPYQLKSANGPAGSLGATYDAAGNLTSMVLARGGSCAPAGAICSHRFAYDWDEVGHLVRARRWDLAAPGAAADPVPTTTPAADLRYAYDANDRRVRKTATDDDGDERHTLYVFAALELRRVTWDSAALDYQADPEHVEIGLYVRGARVGRVELAPSGAPTLPGETGKLHVTLELLDHLGSTSISIDKATSELVERTTYQAFGATESDYRPDRWKGHRADYRFTGKEEDVEVGLQYFGVRYYSPMLGRWISADPATIHALGADLNAYAYVQGAVLIVIDPVGLDSEALKALANATVIKSAMSLNPIGITYGFTKNAYNGVAALVSGDTKGAVDSLLNMVPGVNAVKGTYEGAVGALVSTDKAAKNAALAVDAWTHGEKDAALKYADAAVANGIDAASAGVDLGVTLGGFLGGKAQAWKDSKSGPKTAAPPKAAAEQPKPTVKAAPPKPEAPKAAPAAKAKKAPVKEIPCVECFAAGTLVATAGGLVPIESLRTGQRVLTPVEVEDETDVDPATWERLVLYSANPEGDGDLLRLELLRPRSWVSLRALYVGALLEGIPELGLEGQVVVAELGPAVVQPGEGRVVLGTFAHVSHSVVNLRFAGSDEVVATTLNHPFYSVAADGWKEAGQLEVGEVVATASRTARVESMERASGKRWVFNLEVEGEHEYFVGWAWLLVHNCGNAKADSRPQHAYEVNATDNATGAKTTHKYGVGVSETPGGKSTIRLDGKSMRAEKQVRALNSLEDGNSYSSKIVEKVKGGTDARGKILSVEQELVNKFAAGNGGLGPEGNVLPTPK